MRAMTPVSLRNCTIFAYECHTHCGCKLDVQCPSSASSSPRSHFCTMTDSAGSIKQNSHVSLTESISSSLKLSASRRNARRPWKRMILGDNPWSTRYFLIASILSLISGDALDSTVSISSLSLRRRIWRHLKPNHHRTPIQRIPTTFSHVRNCNCFEPMGSPIFGALLAPSLADAWREGGDGSAPSREISVE